MREGESQISGFAHSMSNTRVAHQRVSPPEKRVQRASLRCRGVGGIEREAKMMKIEAREEYRR